jgi:hypothetical protein
MLFRKENFAVYVITVMREVSYKSLHKPKFESNIANKARLSSIAYTPNLPLNLFNSISADLASNARLTNR